jgi:hypothetical protein
VSEARLEALHAAPGNGRITLLTSGCGLFERGLPVISTARKYRFDGPAEVCSRDDSAVFAEHSSAPTSAALSDRSGTSQSTISPGLQTRGPAFWLLIAAPHPASAGYDCFQLGLDKRELTAPLKWSRLPWSANHKPVPNAFV